MMQLVKRIFCLGLMLAWVSHAGAFALLGPFKSGGTEPWQADGYGGRPSGLGYSLSFDIGGPMFAHEAYRWNVPVITYAFDSSFIRYFGTNGINAVEQAMAILNALPPASEMSATLDEYPFDIKNENSTAAALGLLDVKSYALGVLMEEMGLANPERFVFGLRGRDAGQNFTNYSVIQMNYDPATIQPSRYVNGVLYNYQIFDALGPQGGEWASAIEWYQLDPLRIPYSSVAGIFNSDFQLGSSPSSGVLGTVFGGLAPGQFFRGLTRDDVGGLRYLLSPDNFVVESLLPTVVPSSVASKSSPWGPVFGTNVVGATNVGLTNLLGTNILAGFTVTALRGGVDKITFQRVNFDSLLGSTFTPITNRYTDLFFNPTNGRVVRQNVARVILRPDITFAVDDLGTVFEAPNIMRRTSTLGWTNNAALNSSIPGTDLGGPGIIVPPVVILFSDLLPYFLNVIEGGGDIDAFGPTAWGSFDGSDTPPVVYPQFAMPGQPQISLDYLRNLFLRPKNK